MKILVDADSFPKVARETVLRASSRTGISVIFAANHPIAGMTGDTVIMELCLAQKGAADDRIVELARHGDLVLTRDIPLAYRLVAAKVMVMDDRGQAYTQENIRERLSLRNFMVELAENGLSGQRATVYGKRELKAFANSFDRLLSRLMRIQQDKDAEFV